MKSAKKNATKARLAREQELMTKMGERKRQVESKSLSNFEPKGWLSCCVSWGSGSTNVSAEKQSPLWGGDPSTRVQGDRDDGFYRPMHT